jgi:hypothetical protein
MASAIAWTSFEEKSGKLPDFFGKLSWPMRVLASPETGLQKLATNGTEAVA